MRTKTFIAAALAAAAVAAGAADLQIINFKDIPGIERYEEQLAYVEQHIDHLRPWIVDDRWNYPVSKADLGKKIGAFYDLLDRDTTHPDNQDLYLLKGILAHFLYNLDAEGSYDRAVSTFMHIDALPRRDYRYLWLLGNFFRSAGMPQESIREFRKVIDAVPEDRLHPLFWYDFAHACGLALMPATARLSFERYARLTGDTLQDDSIYRSLAKNLTFPKLDDTIESQKLFEPLARDDGFGILSYPLGAWVPVRENWQYQYGDYSGRKAVLVLTPPRVPHATAGSIGYTIAVFFDLTSDDPVAIWAKPLPNLKPSTDPPEVNGFTLYEYSDPNTYANIGGSHGLLAFRRAECPENPGIALEIPRGLPRDGDGETHYFVFEPGLARFTEPITYVVMLDSCNFIFEQSKMAFIDLLNAMIVE